MTVNRANYPDEHYAETMLREWLEKGRGEGNGFGWMVERSPEPVEFSECEGLYECSVCHATCDREFGVAEYMLLGVFKVELCHDCHAKQVQRLLTLSHLRRYAGKPLSFYTPSKYDSSAINEFDVHRVHDSHVTDIVDRAGLSKRVAEGVREAGREISIQYGLRSNDEPPPPPSSISEIQGRDMSDFDFEGWTSFFKGRPKDGDVVDLMRAEGKGICVHANTKYSAVQDGYNWDYWRAHEVKASDPIIGTIEETGECVSMKHDTQFYGGATWTKRDGRWFKDPD